MWQHVWWYPSLFHSFEKLLGELPDPSDLLLLVLAAPL